MYKKFFLFSIILFVNISFASNLIPLNSPMGKDALVRTLTNNTGDIFLNELKYFGPQHNLTNCAPTSIAIVLNSLKLTPPADPHYLPFYLFTQENIFTSNIIRKTGISTAIVKQHGLTLAQVNSILNAYNGINAQAFYMDNMSEQKVKNTIINAITAKNTAVLVNILRSKMGEAGGGHFSPLAAYDKTTDSVLFMDVAPYREYGPVWVPFSLLYQAMNTKDGEYTRGFIIVHRTN